MPLESVTDDFPVIVGYIGPIGLIIGTIIFTGQCFVKYIQCSPIIIRLSKLSLICNIISIICVILTYYAPYLGSDVCYCGLLWKLALIFFISSLYSLKSMYLMRVYIFCINLRGKIPISIPIIGIFFIICWVGCLFMQTRFAHGSCYHDHTKYGCINSYDFTDIYIGLGLILLDMILFLACFRKWLTSIYAMMQHSPGSVAKKNRKIMQSFRLQLLLTALCLIFTCIDGIFHLIFPKYFSISFFVLDNIMVCIANGFGFRQLRTALYRAIVCQYFNCSCQHHNRKSISQDVTQATKDSDTKPLTAESQLTNLTSFEKSNIQSPRTP